jgi:DNA primase
MRYEENLIEEIRERNDIVDVISSYVNLKKKGADYFGLCPFHNERTPSFSVSRNKQMFYCFGCHKGGNVYTFLMEYNRMSFYEAMEDLAGRAGIEIPEREMTDQERRAQDARIRLKEMNRYAAVYYHAVLKSPRGARAMDYLKNRGLTDETINHFGLGYADIGRDHLYHYLKDKGFSDEEMKDSSLVTIDSVKGSYDRFFNRVMFPIMDVSRRVIGFGGRVTGEGEPKYLNSRETVLFDKGRNLYGLQYAKQSRERALILCEGYMDVISLHQAGFTNAVAPLGTAFTTGQASLLKRYTKEVVLSFDSDGAGVNAALRALPMLREAGLSARVLSMKPCKDPDELIKEYGAQEYAKRIKEAAAGRMFEMEILEGQYDQTDPEGRTRFIRAIAEKLAGIDEAVERGVYMDAAANRFMVRRADLEELVNKMGRILDRSRANQQYKKAPETESRRETRRQNQKNQPQKLLLTYLVEKPEIYPGIRQVVGPEDFILPLYHSVALMIFDQLDRGEDLNPARIVSCFPDAGDQERVAELFHTHLDYEPLPEDRDKALTEIIRKIRLAAIDEKMRHTTDIVKAQELMAEKSRVQRMKLRIWGE